jgi:hypothetical protein
MKLVIVGRMSFEIQLPRTEEIGYFKDFKLISNVFRESMPS